MRQKNNPTKEVYEFLSQLYALVNAECFADSLPNALITVKGKSNVFGFYKHHAYISHAGEHADELAVNPRYFASHGFQELLQTLGHEMTHQWQQHYGRQQSQRSYHNREFADKMISIGLIPSTTGQPGGAQTGQHMRDYLAEQGPLAALYQRLAAEGTYIPWYEQLSGRDADVPPAVSPELPANTANAIQAHASTAPQAGTTRARYVHQCGEDKPATVYGKPGLPLVCGDCGAYWREGC